MVSLLLQETEAQPRLSVNNKDARMDYNLLISHKACLCTCTRSFVTKGVCVHKKAGVKSVS